MATVSPTGSSRTRRGTRRPVALYAVLLLLVLEAVGALFGGWVLMTDPSEPLGMPPSFLAHTPFASYVIPGVVLFVVLGLYPLACAGALLARPDWAALRALERAGGMHWSWLAALAAGIAILVWILVQVLMVRAFHPLQVVIGLTGALIVAGLMLRPVRRAYAAGRP